MSGDVWEALSLIRASSLANWKMLKTMRDSQAPYDADRMRWLEEQIEGNAQGIYTLTLAIEALRAETAQIAVQRPASNVEG